MPRGLAMRPAKAPPLLDTGLGAPDAPEEMGTVVSNLTKSMVGAGALLMPQCYARFGLLGGLATTVLCGTLTAMTLVFTARAAGRSGARDFLSMATEAGLSGRLGLGVGTLMAVLMAAPIIVTVQQTSAYIQTVLKAFLNVALPYPLVAAAVAYGALWPLATVQDRRILARASHIGMMGMAFVLLVVCLDALLGTRANWVLLHSPGLAVGLRTLTVMVFSLGCHLTVPGLLVPMVRRTPAREAGAVCIATALATAFQGVVGAAGYVRHGAEVPPDVLSAGANRILYVAAMAAIAVVNIASFPLVVMPVRPAARFLARCWAASTKSSSAPYSRVSIGAGLSDDLALQPGPSALEALGLVTFGFVTSLGASGIAAVFDVVGALIAGPVFVALPAWLCLAAAPGWLGRRARGFLASVVVGGMVFGLLSVAALFL